MTESEASDHMEAGAVVDPTDPEWGSRKRQRTSGRPSSMALYICLLQDPERCLSCSSHASLDMHKALIC